MYGSMQKHAPGRDLDLARDAFQGKDKDLSMLAHTVEVFNQAAEGHRSDGDSIKSIVYGGLDGVLTCFAIISGAAGGNLSPTTVLILGISNIVADAFAMGVGDAVSTLAYHDHVARERKREVWEFSNYPEGEIEEMIDLYSNRGLPREDAVEVIKTMSKYPDFFIDVMMCEELGLKVPDENESAYKDGFVTFTAFLIFGLLPLLGYLVIPVLIPAAEPHTLFICACAVTMCVLFALGVFKSQFSASTWYASGLEFLLLGSAAASTSYIIGVIVSDLTKELS